MIKMAYFSSIWKARIIEQCRREYENEKINSILTSKTEIPRKTMMQKWRFYGHSTKRRFKGRLRKLFPDGSSVSNLYFYLKSDHAFPNLFMKSAIGFVGGIALTYLCFIFFVYQLSISYPHATIMSSIIGVLLTLGLAFSWRIRCLIFLLIPQMFSRVGRYTLTCYALVLILTGPATNTLRNSEVLTESMACSQEQIKTSVRQINESIKKPFNAMKRPIKLIMDRMKRVASGINTIVSRISACVINIGDFIQSSFAWLNKIAEICAKRFGTPHDRCVSAILQGEYISQVYNESQFAETVCRHVGHNTVCVVADYATASFSATLKRKLRNFISRIKTMLFINMDIHHTHIFSNNNTGYVSPIAAGLVTDIRKKADPLLTWLSWSSCVTSLFLLLIIFRAKYYQHMFETRSRFDNRYVTKELRELDLKRYRERRVTVLPLNKREQTKYICTTSFNLVASEKVYLTRSMVFMAITTFKLLIHMVADYSLYWVLITIRYHGNMKRTFESGHPNIGIEITGSGVVADFIRAIIDSIILPLLPKTPSSTKCLPKPHTPDLQRYMHIGILIILLWFFALFEPYGLRLRHIIMGHYQPERAKARALWLFNHILRTRGSFMKLARRKLHREYKYSDQERLTFRYWINSLMPCSCLKHVFGISSRSKHCLLCNTLEELNDSDTKLTSCETLKCPGVYCVRCFSDIGRLCTICLSPAEYGDISDVSLEKGSSDSDNDEEDKKCGSFNEKESERENLIKKSNVRKSKKRRSEERKNKGSSGSSDSSNIRKSTLSVLDHHELARSNNRPLVGLSNGSLKDICGNTTHDRYGFKEIQHNLQKNVYNVQYNLEKAELSNGSQIFNNIDNINRTSKEIAKRSKISKLAKFLVQKKVKMKNKKRISHNIEFKQLFKLLHKRVVPLEKYSKLSRTKYIRVSTVEKKKRMRRRSQFKLIFKWQPYSCVKPKNEKPSEENEKLSNYITNEANNALNDDLEKKYNNINRKNHYLRRAGKSKYKSIRGYKINKIKQFYKLSNGFNKGQVSKNIRNFKKNKRFQKTNLGKKGNSFTSNKNRMPVCLINPNHDKEMLSKDCIGDDALTKLPKLPVEREETDGIKNITKIPSYCNRINKIQFNEENSKEKDYRTFKKMKGKTVRTPLPFMKEICIWLTSVLSIKRYSRRSYKGKSTAEKGAMALPLVKSRSCQCNGESLEVLNYDTIQKNDMSATKSLFKPCKEFNHKADFRTSEMLSSSDTKTSTTILSCCIMNEYFKRKDDNTNQNKHIFTEKCKLCDVSTLTNDWWSPLEERKPIKSYSKGQDKRKK